MINNEIDFSQLHNRGERGTGRGYKWDFKESDMTPINTLEELKLAFDNKFLVMLKITK